MHPFSRRKVMTHLCQEGRYASFVFGHKLLLLDFFKNKQVHNYFLEHTFITGSLRLRDYRVHNVFLFCKFLIWFIKVNKQFESKFIVRKSLNIMNL